MILNFGKDEIDNFRIGVNVPGKYEELINSNAIEWGGTGSCINDGIIESEEEESHGREYSMVVKVPKLSAVILKLKERSKEVSKKKLVEKDKKQAIMDFVTKVVSK